MEAEKNFKHKLADRYKEEVEDAHEYLLLAKDAEEAQCYITANAIELIAHEEYSHANFIRGRLEEWGMLSHDMDKEWEQLERKFGYR